MATMLHQALDWEIDAPDETLRADPLEWFAAEHARHRQVCRLITELAEDPGFHGETMSRLAAFIRTDLARHVAEEEEELFPLLRFRALPEDEFETALGQLTAEHRSEADLARRVQDILAERLAAGQSPAKDPEAQGVLRAFAAQELQHLALENAVVLPIARLRLTPDDLAALGRRLVARGPRP